LFNGSKEKIYAGKTQPFLFINPLCGNDSARFNEKSTSDSKIN